MRRGEMDEKELIERAKLKDEESFKMLIDKYKNYVFAIILSKVSDYQEAENISQEVFIQIFLSLDSYKDDNFKAWIGRISFNKTIDYLRKKNKEIKEEIKSINFYKLEEILPDNKDPSYRILNNEKGKILLEILEKIPRIYADTIKKHYIEDKSYEEISREENTSIKTVETRLYRGRKMIQKVWEDEYETLK